MVCGTVSRIYICLEEKKKKYGNEWCCVFSINDYVLQNCTATYSCGIALNIEYSRGNVN